MSPTSHPTISPTHSGNVLVWCHSFPVSRTLPHFHLNISPFVRKAPYVPTTHLVSIEVFWQEWLSNTSSSKPHVMLTETHSLTICWMPAISNVFIYPVVVEKLTGCKQFNITLTTQWLQVLEQRIACGTANNADLSQEQRQCVHPYLHSHNYDNFHLCNTTIRTANLFEYFKLSNLCTQRTKTHGQFCPF